MEDCRDVIFLDALEIDCIIGINDWEREQKQTVRIDLEMYTDIRQAAATDRIEHTLNYKSVAKSIIKLVEESRFFLIETMAEEIAKLCTDTFHIPKVKLKVSKPGAIRGSRNVGIMIQRGAVE